MNELEKVQNFLPGTNVFHQNCVDPFNAKAPKHKDAKIFGYHLNPVMLVSIGKLLLCS